MTDTILSNRRLDGLHQDSTPPSRGRLKVSLRHGAWALGAIAALASSPSWAGALSRDMLERRALEALETVYSSGGHSAGGRCRSVDSGLDFLTYYLRCSSKTGHEFWMARSSNGEVVDVSPLDDAAVARLGARARSGPPFENPDYVRAVRASERQQFLDAAQKARY